MSERESRPYYLPSASINFSRIDNTTLKFTIRQDETGAIRNEREASQDDDIKKKHLKF
jgi:hypothetical protein